MRGITDLIMHIINLLTKNMTDAYFMNLIQNFALSETNAMSLTISMRVNMKNVCLNITKRAILTDVIRRFDYRWKSGETSYWRGGFMSLDEYGGLLYFNSPDRIYSYHIKNEEVNEFSAVDTSYGDCYGVRVSDGTIYAAVSKTPNEERTLILAGKCPASQDITKPEILLGDVTQDGVISISDATAVQKYSADLETLSENQLIAADFNGDGVINVIDSTAIQKSIAGL